MEIMVYSLLRVMQDFDHQPYNLHSDDFRSHDRRNTLTLDWAAGFNPQH